MHDATLKLLRRLPDVEGRELVFEWDQEEEWYSVVRCGDLLVWRERTGWEVYEDFARVAALLRLKYGPRLKDLVPTRASLYALLGDSTRANFVVAEAREALGRGASGQRHSLREVARAVGMGDTEVVYEYLARGGNPNWFEDQKGVGLLHLAVRRRRPVVAWMLLNAGAQADALDGRGRTPLARALERPASDKEGEALHDVIQLLLESGADLSRVDPASGLTPLRAAVHTPLGVEMKAKLIRLLMRGVAGADESVGEFGYERCRPAPPPGQAPAFRFVRTLLEDSDDAYAYDSCPSCGQFFLRHAQEVMRFESDDGLWTSWTPLTGGERRLLAEVTAERIDAESYARLLTTFLLDRAFLLRGPDGDAYWVRTHLKARASGKSSAT